MTSNTGKDMPSDVIVSVEGLSKKLCRSLKRSFLYGLSDITHEIICKPRNQNLRTAEFWALKDISFTLKKGECLGIIGPNGSGKSTLLKLLIGLMKPDKGTIMVKGSVAPLIALGAGFNPILSGRENIFINLSILGLSQKEIAACVDEVIAFAELEEAIDSPLRTYSTGMAARLGFACAIQTKPDILMVDEILAVGDIKFRSKCYKKIADLKENGTSIIIVSHNPAQISQVCDIAMIINKGDFIDIGPATEMMGNYEDILVSQQQDIANPEITAKPKQEAYFENVFLEDDQHNRIPHLKTNENGSLVFQIHTKTSYKKLGIGFYLKSDKVSQGTLLRFFSNEEQQFWSVAAGSHQIKLCLTPALMAAGMYTLKAFIFDADPLNVLDGVDAHHIKVSSDIPLLNSVYHQQKEWSITSAQDIKGKAHA